MLKHSSKSLSKALPGSGDGFQIGDVILSSKNPGTQWLSENSTLSFNSELAKHTVPAFTWTPRTYPISSTGMSTVVYGNGLFVAGGGLPGSTGRLITSTDGVSWTAQNYPVPGSADIIRIRFVNGMFIGVGTYRSGEQHHITYSYDAVTWYRSSFPWQGWIYDVCYGNGVYIASGQNGQLGISTNGVNWSAVSGSNLPTPRGTVYELGMFVGGDSEGIVTSTNGTNWTKRTYPHTGSVSGVVYGNGIFIGYGTNGRIATSTNGINWTARTYVHSDSINDIIFHDGIFVAVGRTNQAAYSTDGINWISIPAGAGSFHYNSLAYSSSGRYVVAMTATANSQDGRLHTLDRMVKGQSISLKPSGKENFLSYTRIAK